MPGIPITPIIWLLREKLSPPVFSQQRPRWTAWRPIPRILVNHPWNVVNAVLNATNRKSTWRPSVVHQLLPKPPTQFKISGITKDSAGIALASCVVHWFATATDSQLDLVTSNSSGVYEFRTAGQPPTTYYLVAYKAGSPDVAGTTRNDLTGV